MTISKSVDEYYHHKLPIDSDENILAVYRRHSVVYLIPILIALAVIALIAGLTYMLTSFTGMGGQPIVPASYRNMAMIGVGIFTFLVMLFTYIPIWMKVQDRLVLTDESLIQILQTSLFSDKISQLSLQHIADVTVKAGFWGNLLGYGVITIETPGEQANYRFDFLPDANAAAREISMAHENFISALESGRMTTHFRDAQQTTPFVPGQQTSAQAPIVVDPAQYQEFLRYQQQQAAANPADEPTLPKAQA